MRTLALAIALTVAAPASAEVTASSDTGFTSHHALTVDAPPARVWQTLLRPGSWWEGGHTYSGNAANLSLDARPGGCWCEKTPGRGVEHMRVVFAATNEMLRMTGGLGPLQPLPVAGVMTITLKPAGAGTALVIDYVVAGPGLAGLAAPVDQVLALQWPRLKAAAERAGP